MSLHTVILNSFKLIDAVEGEVSQCARACGYEKYTTQLLVCKFPVIMVFP